MEKDKLEEFKKQLLALRNRTGDELRQMIESLLEGDIPAGEHDAYPSESLERGLILEQNEEFIHRRIREALQRLDDGTYGSCVRCGKEIPLTRLRALPFVRHCLACAQLTEKAVQAD